jgi:hypothetical protein
MSGRVKALLVLGLNYLAMSSSGFCSEIHEITQNTLQTHVNLLASDEMEGRLTGTQGEKRATEYIANIFQQAGLEPAGDNGSYFQAFNFTDHKKLKQGRNVLARLRLTDHADKILIIGAHVDHLGRGEVKGSRQRNNETGMIHAGADDNASGVATVLEMAIKLQDLKKHGQLQGNKDILFAAWSGEELGVLGSSFFIKHYQKHPQVDAVINLDMVGHLRKKLVIQGVGSGTNWADMIAQIKNHHAMPVLMQNDPYLPTDSTSFYLRGIPTLNFFTGAHDNYHTPRDTPDTLNYAGMKSISDFLMELMQSLEVSNNLIRYHAVKKPREYFKNGFRMYLGTIPDYASAEIKGVRLSGVAKYSPAERAGIKSDDVIIKLAGKPVHDIYDYMQALNDLPADKPVKLWVRRGRDKKELTVVAKLR